MGKNGPCYHCGVTSTPLWRNGPPEKPILCNACGSRWRTKGTLTNYTPLHSRPELIDFEVHRVPKVKIVSPKKNKEVKLLKRKKNHDNVLEEKMFFYDNRGYKKVKEEDTSNRSSSGSAISNPESCTQFGGTDASELTGPVQSVLWETTPASKRRTCVGRSKASSIEKLTKDLYTILHEQQSLHLSVSSEEELLFESEAPMVSVEIGHGGVLIRHPSSIARDEESEASSISIYNKNFLTKSVAFATMPVHNESKGVNFPLEQKKREKSQRERFQVLASSNSPMCDINLHDVINFEEFMTHFTDEEHQELVKYLPFVDTSEFPNSLKSMFDNDQFKESVPIFQKLLAEGVFDGSLVGVKMSDCKTLKRLALHNLRKGQWVEHYNLLKKCKNSTKASPVGGPNVSKSSESVSIKRLRDDQNQIIPADVGAKVTVPKSTKANYPSKESIYNDGYCFSPRSLFRLPPENSSFMFDSYHFANETSEQDILLDVPSNNSFPQAELLPQMSGNSSLFVYPQL